MALLIIVPASLALLVGSKIVALRQLPPPVQEAGLPVETVAVSVGSIRECLNYTGTVESAHQASLSPEVMAEIRTVTVKEGDRVTLDPEELANILLESRGGRNIYVKRRRPD